jgi:hypothetical protein
LLALPVQLDPLKPLLLDADQFCTAMQSHRASL